MVEKNCYDESNSAAVVKVVGFVTRVPTLAVILSGFGGTNSGLGALALDPEFVHS